MVLSAAGAQLTQVVPTGQSRRCRALAHFLRLPPVFIFIWKSVLVHSLFRLWSIQRLLCVPPLNSLGNQLAPRFFSFFFLFSKKDARTLRRNFSGEVRTNTGASIILKRTRRERNGQLLVPSLFFFKQLLLPTVPAPIQNVVE